MPKPQAGLDYGEYLRLGELLSCQSPKSAERGQPAHDEMLFVIVHQVYELWFKQVLHELDSVMALFREDSVDERGIGVAVSRLQRVTEIQKILVDQLRVLETMTPLDFLEFRDLLVPASGFQSWQFRLIENKLGLRASEAGPSANDRRTIETNATLTEAEVQAQLAELAQTEASFAAVLDEKAHERLRAEGRRRLSHRATRAALFIHLYRDQPILHLPFRFLTLLVDVDELLSAWRYRHALMVHRMIGTKIGTGGSSGHRYLLATVERNKIFTDLYDLSTFLISRSALPPLPPEMERRLGFHYPRE